MNCVNCCKECSRCFNKIQFSLNDMMIITEALYSPPKINQHNIDLFKKYKKQVRGYIDEIDEETLFLFEYNKTMKQHYKDQKKPFEL